MRQNQSGWLGLEKNSEKGIPGQRQGGNSDYDRFPEEEDNDDVVEVDAVEDPVVEVDDTDEEVVSNDDNIDISEIPGEHHNKDGQPHYRNPINDQRGQHLEHQKSPTNGHDRIDHNSDIF